MWPIIVFCVLWVTSYSFFAVGIRNWGSDSGFHIAAFIGGWISTSILTAFGVAFAVVNTCLWLWHHVRVEVTW